MITNKLRIHHYQIALVISSPLAADILPIINLPVEIGNVSIASSGVPLVPIGNDIKMLTTTLTTSSSLDDCPSSKCTRPNHDAL